MTGYRIRIRIGVVRICSKLTSCVKIDKACIRMPWCNGLLPGFFPVTSRKASLCTSTSTSLVIPGHLDATGNEEVTVEKDIGIHIDSGLAFTPRQLRQSPNSRTSQLLTVVNRSIANIDLVTLPLIYKTLVRSFAFAFFAFAGGLFASVVVDQANSKLWFISLWTRYRKATLALL